MQGKYHVVFVNGHAEDMVLTDEEALLYWYSTQVKLIKPIYEANKRNLFEHQFQY